MADISVIIPVYNRSFLLKRAIASIGKQTIQPKEILVIDDCSTENLQTVLSQYQSLPIIYHRLVKNSGAAEAKNTGIKLAQNDKIAFLDSDDEWLPNKLEEQLKFHNSIKGLISTTGYSLVDKNGNVIKQRIFKELQIREDLLKGCFLSPGSTMIANRAIFDKVGLFNSNLRRYEDWEWLLRATQQTNIHVLPKVLSIVHYSGRPSYTTVIAESKKLTAVNNERKLKAYTHIEIGFHAACEKKYGAAIKHFLISMFIYPFTILDLITRTCRFVKDRLYFN